MTEFQISCPEVVPCPDPVTPDNEFSALLPPEQDSTDVAARKARRMRHLRKNFLFQAAAAFLVIVIVTSAMGVDILGGLSGTSLEHILDSLRAGKGVITISMLWNTTDDIDLHVVTPSGEEIYYANPQAGGGILDVDMQVSYLVDEPVENVFFETAERGTYSVFIVNFTDRNPGDSEVLVRVSVRGKVTDYHVVLDKQQKPICSFTY